jgi:hypothetical protein
VTKNDRAIAQPLPGLRYRITYNYKAGAKRQATGTFVGIDRDPIVPNPDTGLNDKITLHFILTDPVIRELATQALIPIEAPKGVDIHFHVWPEDLVDLVVVNSTDTSTTTSGPHTEE